MHTKKYGCRGNCRFDFELKNMRVESNCRFECVRKNMGVELIVDLTEKKKKKICPTLVNRLRDSQRRAEIWTEKGLERQKEIKIKKQKKRQIKMDIETGRETSREVNRNVERE